MNIFIFGFILSWIVVNKQESTNSISIKKIERDINVDGRIEAGEWASFDSIKGLCAPWSSVGSDQTVFKFFCSSSYLNFCFDVVDKTPITFDFVEELTVAKEDRVELFFSATPNLSKYYCIEMDPLGNILDYSAKYYRKFNEAWDFSQTKIATHIAPGGYLVEGRISLSELAKLGIQESFYLGIFRADYINKKTNEVIWYSWIDPGTDEPDFHIPSALGVCIIMNDRLK